ncbi:MAG: hypothetical protein AAB473_05010 [Patescibacteria group bacterium]
MFFSLLLVTSLFAHAETPGFYVEPLLPNVEFAMVRPDDCTPANGCISVTNTGGTMLALTNNFFPGPTRVMDAEGYTVGVYIGSAPPLIVDWVVSPVTGLQIPVVDGSFTSVMLQCTGGAKSTVYVNVENASTVSLSVTSVGFTKKPGLLGVDVTGMKVLAADSAADAQVAIDARTGVIVKYYLGYGRLNQTMPGSAFTVRTSSGATTYAFDRAFGDGQCLS